MDYNSIGSIIAVLGNSGAGKDTVSSIILDRSDAKVYKWSAPMKRMLEYAYDLPTGSLDDRVIRSQEVPDMSGVTYLDLMVRAFTHFRAIDDLMMIRKVSKDISAGLKNGKTVVLNDLRTPAEAKVVSKLGKLYPLHIIFIERCGFNGLESDQYLLPNFRTLSPVAQTVHKIQNRDLDTLTNEVNTILERIKRNVFK